MFLAWKEIWYNKKKFSLIISLIVLITFLVYFLTSLAYGLASSYSDGINKIEANYIVLSENSNDNAMMSMLVDEDFNKVSTSGDKQRLGLFPAVVSNETQASDEDSRIEIYAFGVQDIEFFIPESDIDNLEDNEVIVDSSVKDLGYEKGDNFVMSGNSIKWTIVGFTEKATYQTAPIVYTNLNTWREYRFNGQPAAELFNAVVVKGDSSVSVSDDLVVYEVQEYIQTLPGYTPQVLTFSMMIGFLIVIIAFVLGIFIYVLTIQKTSMFGVMKAQGISNAYISSSVISQTVLIVFIGAFIGFSLTRVLGLFFKEVIPFAGNYNFYGIITFSFFLFAVFGGLFSVKAVVKIDPLEAIG